MQTGWFAYIKPIFIVDLIDLLSLKFVQDTFIFYDKKIVWSGMAFRKFFRKLVHLIQGEIAEPYNRRMNPGRSGPLEIA